MAGQAEGQRSSPFKRAVVKVGAVVGAVSAVANTTFVAMQIGSEEMPVQAKIGSALLGGIGAAASLYMSKAMWDVSKDATSHADKIQAARAQQVAVDAGRG